MNVAYNYQCFVLTLELYDERTTLLKYLQISYVKTCQFVTGILS